MGLVNVCVLGIVGNRVCSLVFAAAALNVWLCCCHAKKLKWNKAASHIAKAFPAMVDLSIFKFIHLLPCDIFSESYSFCHALSVVENLLHLHPTVPLDIKHATT